MMAASWIAYLRNDLHVPLVGSLILLICLLALSAIDLETGLLPNWLTLPLIALGLLQNWTMGNDIWMYLIGGLVGYGLIYVLSEYWRQKRGQQGIGLGDAKLLAASGAWVGVYALPGVLLAASTTGIIALAVWSFIRKRSPKAKQAIPFGPFLALGTWVMWCNTFVIV